MINKFIATSIVVLSLFSLKSNASHITTSEIYYRHISSNDYRITLALFRDCAGIQSPASVNMDANSSCGSFTFSAAAVDTNDVTPVCQSQLSTCNGGTWPGREIYVYATTVTLPPCSDWVLSYSMCCRNAASVNVQNPSMYGIYLESKLDNSNAPNSSPTFMSTPSPFLCTSGGCVNNTAYDFDGDSLVFSLVAPRDDAGTNLAFIAPYSATQPFGNAGTFNTSSGNICVDSTVAAGGYVFALQIDEYRNGQWIGSVTRDAQVNMVSCSAPDSTTIAGTVVDGFGSPAPGAWVKLFNYDIVQGSMPVIDSIQTDAAGNYSMTTSVYDQYMVRATPDTIANPNTLPSYHAGSYYWNTGQVIFSMCDSVLDGSIVLADQGNPVGIGAVSGYLYGYGLLRGGWPDQPEGGIYVYVIDRSTGMQVAHSITDVNGYYEISTLEPGDYELLAEIPGLMHISTHHFTVTSSESYSDFNLVATDDGIYATSSTLGLSEIDPLQEFRVYPIPSSDYILIDGVSDQITYEIVSTEGRTIRKERISPKTQVSVSDLAPGIYFMKIDGYRSQRFIVK